MKSNSVRRFGCWRQTCGLAALAAIVSGLGGCQRMTSREPQFWLWRDMKIQEKYKPQQASPLFADGRADRLPPEGTVAVGYLKENEAFYTGAVAGMYVGKNPLPVNVQTLARGRQRFDIYCAPCHSRTGDGRGMVPIRTPGWQASNLLEDRIQNMVDGEIFQIITWGRRTMHGYRYQISEKDRWAIVAYVRALQRAQRGTLQDVPQELRGSLR